MRLKIRKAAAEAIGLKALEKFGISEPSWAHNEMREIELATLSIPQVKALEKMLEPHNKRHGMYVALYDLRVWLKAQTNPDQWARDARQMASLLKLYIGKVPGQRIFRRQDDQWLCYYVNYIEYVPKSYDRENRVIPPHVIVHLAWEILGGHEESKITIWDEDCRRKSPAKVLSENNMYIETEERRKVYLDERARFMDVQPRTGLQLHVWGHGADNLDDKEDSWRFDVHLLGSQESPGRAVVDIYHEKERSNREHERNKVHLRSAYWSGKTVVRGTRLEEEDDVDDDEMEEALAKLPAVIEVPIHPYLAVFDLSLHLRLRVHVNNTEVHVYDKNLGDKLVLPKELKQLVSLLIEQQSGTFRDIIRNKTGGAVVLLTGPPGTGKTLTAEVYAEAEERPLYSIQCSQLGINPDELEEELLKCFVRARRWRAVILLDEADVYVHKRGDSLVQNAIVGVFLRVLEYQSEVLFMTTNRPDDVDDAIASRCIAKLSYKNPSPDDQLRIWKVLGENHPMAHKEMARVVKDNPDLSGRDVKNLLKLALLSARGGQVTAKLVEYVKQFKPTR